MKLPRRVKTKIKMTRRIKKCNNEVAQRIKNIAMEFSEIFGSNLPMGIREADVEI